MSETGPGRDNADPPPHPKPRGAILIATLVGLTTLVVWFALFAITAGRYAP